MIRSFFYGSLRKGHYNNDRILGEGSELIGTTSLPGFDLYSLGAYPCAVPVDDPNHFLVGEVWEIPNEVARGISAMERGAGYDEKEVNTEWGKANIWIMLEPPIFATRVESGDWNERKKRG